MKIKEGYNSQPFEITVNARKGEKTMELWFINLYLPKDREKSDMLSYITIEEALELRDALNKALKESIGL